MFRKNDSQLLAIAAAALLGGSVASAQQFELDWYTIDGGGGTATGASFSISGTFGQADASEPLTGSQFTLTGGFWPGVEAGMGALVGDMNCDGLVSVSDIGPFVLALTDPAGYAAQFPDCDINNADVNGDGFVTVGDIGGFVALLTGG